MEAHSVVALAGQHANSIQHLLRKWNTALTFAGAIGVLFCKGPALQIEVSITRPVGLHLGTCASTRSIATKT